MRIIPIVIAAFGTVTKGLLKGLEDLEAGGRVETIQTTALLRTARTLRRVLETWGDFIIIIIVVPLARISLTLSHHFSLSFITFGRSSGLHPVSSHSCCMHVRASRPAFAWPYARVHRSTSLMSSSLLLQQCPACLARLTCIVFVMGDKWAVQLVSCGVLPPRTCSVLLSQHSCVVAV